MAIKYGPKDDPAKSKRERPTPVEPTRVHQVGLQRDPAADSFAPGQPRKGRPRIEDQDKTIEAQKPWIALGMSRRTWYRRKAGF